MTPNGFCRTGFWADEYVWREVIRENFYRLPDKLAGYEIMDFGAHIGCFSLACLARGADRVIAIEPDPHNFKKLRWNLRAFEIGGAMIPICAAGWRSTYEPLQLRMTRPDPRDSNYNTAAGTVAGHFGPSSYRVPTVSPESLEDKLTWAGKVILKLDCEGAEYPIIYHSTILNKFSDILVEAHEIGLIAEANVNQSRANAASMKAFLTGKGFEVIPIAVPSPNLEMFWAKNKSGPA